MMSTLDSKEEQEQEQEQEQEVGNDSARSSRC